MSKEKRWVRIKDAPEFSNNTISVPTEGVVDLDWQISSGVILCRALLVLARWFIDW